MTVIYTICILNPEPVSPHMSILGRLLAMFLGATALPLLVLYNHLIHITFEFFMGLTAFIGLSVLGGFVIERLGLSLLLNVLITACVIIPVAAVVVTLGFVAAAIYLTCAAVIDVFKVMLSGIKNGFLDGMDGFWRCWDESNGYADESIWNSRPHISIVSVGPSINDMDDPDFAGLNLAELVDVVVPPRPFEVLELEIAAPVTSVDRLDEKEITKARTLINRYLKKDMALPPGLKNQLEQLNKLLDNYQSLSTRLDLAQIALRKKQPASINDELLSMEIEEPILLFKQYQISEGVWHSVPALTYITDKGFFLKWLERDAPFNPVNRDDLKNPPSYDGKSTRYRWHSLTAEQCSAQELIDEAGDIRQLLETLSLQLQTKKTKDLNPALTFFGSKPGNVQEPAKQEALSAVIAQHL